MNNTIIVFVMSVMSVMSVQTASDEATPHRRSATTRVLVNTSLITRREDVARTR